MALQPLSGLWPPAEDASILLLSLLIFFFFFFGKVMQINPLTPNVNYSGRTAPLTSKVAFYIFIQQIYVLNIFNTVYSYTVQFFSSKCSLFHNCNVFGTCIIPILYTACAKI